MVLPRIDVGVVPQVLDERPNSGVEVELLEQMVRAVWAVRAAEQVHLPRVRVNRDRVMAELLRAFVLDLSAIAQSVALLRLASHCYPLRHQLPARVILGCRQLDGPHVRVHILLHVDAAVHVQLSLEDEAGVTAAPLRCIRLGLQLGPPL